jgi:hypothetical protein
MKVDHKTRLVLGILGAIVVCAGPIPAAAMHDPVTGRWITRDPLAYNASASSSAGGGRPAASQDTLMRHTEVKPLYEVTDSSPTAKLDPSGEAVYKCCQRSVLFPLNFHCWVKITSATGAKDECAGMGRASKLVPLTMCEVNEDCTWHETSGVETACTEMSGVTDDCIRKQVRAKKDEVERCGCIFWVGNNCERWVNSWLRACGETDPGCVNWWPFCD